MASSSPSSSSSPPLVVIATSSEETLLLTRTGEVLVCRHVDAADNQIDADDAVDEDGIIPLDIDNISKTQSSELRDDCSLNANSFEATITGRNKLHRQKQRHSLQKAWAECCEPERFCDLSTSNTHNSNLRSSGGRGGGLLGGSEEHLDELLNGMNSKLNIIDVDSGADNSDWNTVSPKRRKKLQQQQQKQQQEHLTKSQQPPKLQQQPLLQTPPRNLGNRRRGKNDCSPSSIINNFGSTDDSDEEEHDDNPDRININDVQLQDHNNFTFIGGSGDSPTPMLSFDYSGYEPPTPENLLGTMNDDSSVTSTEATFSIAGLPPPLPSTLASLASSTTPASSYKKGNDSGNKTMTINGHHHQDEHLNEQYQQHKEQKEQHQRRRRSQIGKNTSSVLSGIPTFLQHLSQIRITHLSAHPRGNHVLLISEEGLLFSYGSNEYGQLGLGRFHKKGGGKGREIVTIPSIVTPLLENGGKTVNCAAGVDYSLVVVRIEGSRLANRRYNKVSPSSSLGKNSPNYCIIHHQMYAFGNNEDMKLGLLDPDGNGSRRDNSVSGNFATPRRNRVENEDLDSPGSASLSCCFSTPESFSSVGSGIEENGLSQANCVFLPRRVALHCRVIPRNGTNSPIKQSQTDLQLEYGIFNVAASSDHSAALVRRPSGAVELYSWGKLDALRQPVSYTVLEDDILSPRRWECVPSLKPQKKMQNGLTIAAPTLVTALSSLHESQSSGKNGAPPRFHSPRKESRHRFNAEKREETKSLLNPTEYVVNVALGPSCTHAITSFGRWFAFGSSTDGLLGLGANTTTSHVPTEVKLTGSETIQSISIGEKHAVAVSSAGSAYMWGRCPHGIAEGDEHVSSPRHISFADKKPNTTKILEDALIRHIGLGASSRTNNAPDNAVAVVYAHAGRDLSVFVLESGSVLTCGKKSGRLGQGDINMDVKSPRQMFGGLQLWRN
jgi:alpha-tubulin suppressor-like RCC1 family protein